MKPIKSIIGTVSVAALLASGGPVMARSANTLADLVGARAGQAEGQLTSRGFTHIDTSTGQGAQYAYWWNQSADDCVRVTTSDGRYAAIVDVADSDCNKHTGNGAGTAVAVGVGAAILGALIAGGGNDQHRSHNHQDGQHNDNTSYEVQYERGYRDGLYNESYHNADRADGYAAGYDVGVRERESHTSHRRGHAGRGGYAPSVDVSDLQGARARDLDGLENRGFRQVDNFTNGNTRYAIWWNGNTMQCLQATIADGRVYDIRDIGSHPNCR
jgi:hypothetical protein